MLIRTSRTGFTIVELLAVVGMIAAGASLTSVGMGLGSAAHVQPQPGDPATERIEKIRRQLDKMRHQIKEIEDELLAIEAEQSESVPGALSKARATARQLKDATHVRGIHQSLVIWAQQNHGRYPLPSRIDTAGATIPADAAAKDTTANIFSVLVFNGYISPEICISPAEASPSIAASKNYQFDRPAGAKDSAQALWDPAFSADFTAGKTGNVSYAHLQPAGPRLKLWSDTFVATEAIVANRGPEIQSVERPNDPVPSPKTSLAKSVTYLIHGETDRWEGNVAFNDGHVTFETALVREPNAPWPTYLARNDSRVSDVFFYDEPDSKERGGNLFLGIFTTAGKTLDDWTAIWD